MKTEGYVHYFDRFFAYENQEIDRLEQIRRLGILSPGEAKKMGVPYISNYNHTPSIDGLDPTDYLKVIFLYPLEVAKNLTSNRGDSWVLLSNDLNVITPQEMRQKLSGKWVVLSPGEVYAIGRIDPKYIVN